MKTASTIARAMQSFVIEGGRPLSGYGARLGEQERRAPDPRGVRARLGRGAPLERPAHSRRRDDGRAARRPRRRRRVDGAERGSRRSARRGRRPISTRSSAREIRASFLLAGPLLARFGRVTVPPPGGDVIGRRRLDTHVHAFAALGADVELDGVYELSTDGLRGTRMYLDEASVMGTENAIMAAVLAEGETVARPRGLRAAHPGSLPLPRLARRARSRASARTSSTSTGVDELGGGRLPHRPRSHRGRELRRRSPLRRAARSSSTDVEPDDLISIVPAFRKLGVEMEVVGLERSRARRPGPARRGRLRRPDPEDRERRLARVPGRPDVDRGHGRDPGARNDPHLREDVREPPLLRGQARLDGRANHPLRPASRRRHRARPTLYGERLESPDIRAGMAMLIAALCAEGTSTIGNIRPDRPRLRAHRRTTARARRGDRADRAVTNGAAAASHLAGAGRVECRDRGRRARSPARGARATPAASSSSSRSRPTSPRPRSARPGAALGEALAPLLARDGRRGSRLRDRARGRGARDGRRRGLGQAARRLERRPHVDAGRRPPDRSRRGVPPTSSPRPPGSRSTFA